MEGYMSCPHWAEQLERKISSFGYFPRWSPDSSQILFQTHFAPLGFVNKFYLAHLDGSAPNQVLAEFFVHHKLWPAAAVWHPDGKRISAGPRMRR